MNIDQPLAACNSDALSPRRGGPEARFYPDGWCTADHQATSEGLEVLAVGGIYDWEVLGRPITLLLLEAVFFCGLVILIDQYKRQGSCPWPLHRLPELVTGTKAQIQRWRGRGKGGGADEREGYQGVQQDAADPNIEMTQREVCQCLPTVVSPDQESSQT
jgi:hypothetical protein